MMTKLEKRVLAGIMSVMMCFSVVQMPMKSVKAEDVAKETVVSEKAEVPEIILGQLYEEIAAEGTNESGGEYKFTPLESGRYVVTASNYLNVYASGGLSHFVENQRVNLKAGETYYMTMKCYRGDVKWRMDKTEEIDIQEDKVYTTDVGQVADYRFIPKEAGIYDLSFITVGECLAVFDDNMEKPSKYNTRVSLEAGKAYYFAVKAKEEPTIWKVRKMKELGAYAYDIKEDGTIEILGYQGNENIISIPKTVDGKIVTEIGAGAFYHNSVIGEVTIPNTVRKIAESAFYGCNNLQKVEFEAESQLKSIDQYAFGSCGKLNEMVIPEGVENLGNRVFAWTDLEKIDIPNSVLQIGEGAFIDCNSLQSVHFGIGLTKIPNGIFMYCSSLKQVDFSDKSNVVKIEYDAFYNCSSLPNLKLPESVQSMGVNVMKETAWNKSQTDGVLYMEQILYGYKGEMPENTEISVQDGTVAIADGAFKEQVNLMDVKLADGVRTIGKMSFYNCSSMNSIIIPESVKEIGDYAFGYIEGEWGKDVRVTGDGFYEWVKKMDDFTIYGIPGSAAQKYAKENGFTFVSTLPFTKGDVNDDGNIDSADLRLVLRAVCGKEELTDTQKAAADVEGNGNGVDSQDMRKILQFVCGKIEEL